MNPTEICELIGMIIALASFWGRIEHRLTKLEAKIDELEERTR